MFTAFYNLSGRPFQLSPDHRFFFGSRSHQKAMAYLKFGLHQGEGFIVITGEIGAGKTTLVGYLLAQLEGTKYVVGKVVTTQLDADDTLRMVTSAFGIPHEGQDKATLLRRFEAFLSDHLRHGKRVLLLIDEAQNLPARSLEELRMLSNFQVNERAPMQVFLLGQPQFRQTLSSEGLEQLRQRVIASYHLTPMDATETRGYVEHRLRLVNWRDDPKFAEDAYEHIFAHTDGVPRRINTLCTRLLLFGALEEKHLIDAAAVEEVAGDLMQEGAQPTYAPGSAGLPGTDRTAPAPAARAAGPEVLAEIARLAERVDALERAVNQHERTMKRAIEILANYLEASSENKVAPGPPLRGGAR